MVDSTRRDQTMTLQCPTCAARYLVPPWQEGAKYGCKKCGASLLFGKFALLQELGRGGFGVVYKAWQADLQRIVALKLLHAETEDAVERFLREARIAANLSHPNITAIYEVGRHEGKPYITMQYVDGLTTNKAQLSPREAVAVIRDAALAVDYAHAREIIHRDIKPHNIMTTEERSGTSAAETTRRVFVMDFGLARSTKGDSSLTAEGQVMGTPAFMAPEQAEGKTCDSKSDVYSLGATLYALATKRAPFEAATPVQILMKVTRGEITPPSKLNPEVDANLESIILKAMALDPARRYATASRLAGDLALWLQGGVPDSGATVHLSATSKPMEAVRSPGKKAGLAVAAAVAVAVAAAGAGAVLFLGKDKLPAAPAVVEDYVAVKLESTPSGATVTAEGGSRSWVTPGEIRAAELKGETIRLTFTKAGYVSTTRPVTLVKGAAQLAFATLDPEASVPSTARLLLDATAEPAGARLFIGGREHPLPAKLTERDLPAGDYDVEVRLDGYQTQTRKLTLNERAPEVLAVKLERMSREQAFVLASTPPGARVLIGERDTGLVTPTPIYRDQVKNGVAAVELQLEGYESAVRSVELRGASFDVKIDLVPLTGSFTVSGAQPRAAIKVVAVPPGLKSPKAVAQLWSENAEALEAALAALEPADVPAALPRLKELAGRPEPGIRGRAAKLAAGSAAARPAKLETATPADGAGTASFPRIPVAQRYVVLATSADAKDFVSDEIQPLHRKETLVRAEMASLVTVSADVRPALGHFEVVLDGKPAGRLDAQRKSMRVPSGVVVLKFVPPEGVALLCPFSATKTVVKELELNGNLYRYCGEAFESDGDLLPAVGAYTKALEEKAVPAGERAAMDALPGRIRELYRLWIEGLEKKPLGEEALRRVQQAAGRKAEEVAASLPEVYAAADLAKPLRGQAAGLLAAAHAKLKRPYEAAEWLERAAREGVDPGGEVQGETAAAGRGFPGLPERAKEVAARLEALRAAATRKPGFLGVRVTELPGRGLRVDEIAKGSPAEGVLRFGDLITSLGETAAALQEALGAGPGAELEIHYERGGAKADAKVALAPPPAREPEYLKPPPRVGVLQLVSEQYGIHVNLDENAVVEPGEPLEVLSGGAVVGELTALKRRNPDETYKFGSLECKRVKGAFKRGDEVRKAVR